MASQNEQRGQQAKGPQSSLAAGLKASSTIKLLKELKIHRRVLHQTIKERHGRTLQPMVLDQEERSQLGPKMLGTHTQIGSACGGRGEVEEGAPLESSVLDAGSEMGGDEEGVAADAK
ncbi:unnamed protein product [Pleuronectes platessa]|uniref:Uncharacterized protein n=1 Tax=Pleuronectes platessa TaxID=8262 RepID=A0A9N7Z6G9_PLEPL|nr:unnamed protein product [Pleuronectes platessa]